MFIIVAVIAATASVWPPAALLSIVLLAAVVGLRYPMSVASVTIVAGMMLPDYIGTRMGGFGVVLNGRFACSLLLLYLGLIATRDHRSPHVRHVQWGVTVLAIVWLASTFLATSGSLSTRVEIATAAAVPDVAALIGGVLLACAPGGRRRLVIALVAAGSLASVAALAEFATQRNPLLEIGVGFGLGADQWAELPARFGLLRSAGAFGHPIELGVVLGMTLLAALEAARMRALPTWFAMSATTLMFCGQLTTLSRGPVIGSLAAITLWTLWARPLSARWRVGVFVVVVSITLVAVGQANLDKGLVSFVDTGEETSTLGGTAEHRVLLTQEFFEALPTSSLTGSVDVRNDTTVGREFVTVDHEGLYILLGRGLLGLLSFGLILLWPVFYDLRRIGIGVTREPYASLSAVYLVVTGATVAFFGPLQTYMWLTLAIMWSTVALASEIPGARVAGLTFRDEDPRAGEGLGLFR